VGKREQFGKGREMDRLEIGTGVIVKPSLFPLDKDRAGHLATCLQPHSELSPGPWRV
jgi:hypothetical protein